MNRWNDMELPEENEAWQRTVPKQRTGEGMDCGGRPAHRKLAGSAAEDCKGFFVHLWSCKNSIFSSC